MALVTVQRSPSASNSPPSSEYGSSIHTEEEIHSNRSLSEYYFAVKGFAVLLPKKECQQGRQRKSAVPPADIQRHLQSILHLLRPGDTLQMAVRLESLHTGRIRYLAVATAFGRQDSDESCLLGVDFSSESPSIGLVLAVLADTMINLDGDGGFSVSSAGRKHIFKPISVQAMWSALQTVHKESGKARDNHFYQGGLNHDWVGYYDRNITSDQSCINEWNAMEGLESKRPPSPDSLGNKEETELLIRGKLKEIMMSVNIDEVTSKYIRQRLEEDIKMDLFKYKSFIDQEMLTILGQMDAATEIFPHVYLGSEWNASNMEELKNNGVGFILNVTKEIDNFFPGMFDYLNIRVYDDEKTELLRHWDDTYKYISQVKDKGSKVLVHCKMGISRSASVVIAYAMKAHNLSLEDATKLVKNKRSCIKPNQAFTSQLKIYQGILDASRQRHNALFRSKSETNLKSSMVISSSHTNMRLSYVPRGMQILPIPDFRPRSSASVCENVEREEVEVSDPCRGKAHLSLCENKAGNITLRVPSPIQSRRPRSWSPDEDNARNLSLHPYNESEFGESLQKSRSLNDQAWHAHVTVVQRDLRDPGGGDGGLIEAVNPLYAPEKTSQPSQRVEDLQLSSSVKEIINEFESAKNGSGGVSTKCPSGKSPLTITLDQATTTSSSTDDMLEYVADSLVLFPSQITRTPNSQINSPSSEPVVEETGIIPSKGSSSEEDTPHSTEIPEDSPTITWPTSGIVRKQKEDFEEKVKLRKEVKLRDQDSYAKQDYSHSENILQRQSSSQSLNAMDNVKMTISPDGMETAKKEDLFSSKVDKVFDKEEKSDKSSPSCFTGDNRESPSRNSSWGSFDGAVVLPDRDAPSRQSSWGSCDTRLSGGSLLSRNSSFGAFDTKPSFAIPPYSIDNSYQTNYVAFCIDKENMISSRRIKPHTAKNVIIGDIEDNKNEEYVAASRSVANSKAYMPLPFKTQNESDDKLDVNASHGITAFPTTNHIRDFNTISPGISPVQALHEFDATESLAYPLKISPSHDTSPSDSCYRSGVKRGFKSSPQTPEHEIPLPGTVKQQMQKLECKTKQILRNDYNTVSFNKTNKTTENSTQGIGRSLSSGCVSSNNHPIPISRSSSEKRAKTDIEGSKGNVKKITKALENQYSDRAFPPSEMSRSFKRKGKRERPEVMPRSHSLERLGGVGTMSATSSPPTPNKRLSAYSPRSDMTSSQNFLDQLVVEAQAQVQQLEREQEEISVKNLVGLFEEVKTIENKNKIPSTRQDFTSGNGGSAHTVESQLEKNIRRNIRPRSESMSERELVHLPPVPQRKSSLDHTFIKQPSKPVSSSNVVTTANDHSASGMFAIGVTVTSNSMHHNSKGTILNPPKPPPLPAAQNSRDCGSEVRRRKQQGKTHPLSKLTPREKTL